MLPILVFVSTLALGAWLRTHGARSQSAEIASQAEPLPTRSALVSTSAGANSHLGVFRDHCAEADLDRIQSLAEALRSDPGAREDGGRWFVLLQRWAQLSPDAALAFVEEWSPRLSLSPTLEALCWQAWATVAPDEAMAAAYGRVALTAILQALAEYDPDRVISYFDGADGKDIDVDLILSKLSHQRPEEAARLSARLGRRGLAEVAAAWASEDPVHAWQWASEEVTDGRRRTACVGAMTAWMRRDPAAAKAALTEMPASRTRAYILARAGFELAKKSPEEAIRWMTDQAGTGERAHAFADIARRLAGRQPEVATRFLDALGWDPDAVQDIDHYRIGNTSSSGSSVNLRKVIRDVVQSTLKEDPARALAMVQGIGQDALREGLFNEFLGDWARQDAAAVDAWIDEIQDPSERERANFGYGQAMARVDPVRLDNLLAALEDPKQRRAFSEGAARTLAQSDSDAALDWVGQLPKEEASELQQALMDHWQDHHHKLAFKHLDLLGSEPDTVNTFLDKLGGEWGNEDPVQMAQFLSSQPEPNPRWCGFAAFCWMGEDPEAAANWTVSLPEGPARDEASASVAQRFVDSPDRDFEAALTWIETIQGAEQRAKSMTYLGNAWWQSDPDAAAQFVPNHEPEVKPPLAEGQIGVGFGAGAGGLISP